MSSVRKRKRSVSSDSSSSSSSSSNSSSSLSDSRGAKKKVLAAPPSLPPAGTSSQVALGGPGLNPGDSSLRFKQSVSVQSVPTFEAMGLPDRLLQAIYQAGFRTPSAIQQRAVVPIKAGRDVVLQAQSGTGKTAAFSVGSLARLGPKSSRSGKGAPVELVVLSPTRELAEQTHEVISALGDLMGIRCAVLVGGKSVGGDTRALSRSPHAVAGTPGRVLDLVKRSLISLKGVKVLVIDEADEMMTRGFKEQVCEIYKYLPVAVQVVVVSATLSPDVLEVTGMFTTDPVQILVKREEVTVELISMYRVDCGGEEWKFETLCDLYETLTIGQGVIFANSRKKVEWLTAKMKAAGHTVGTIHGDLSQKEREAVLNTFRQGACRVLITTDILARGIDVHQVTHVFNYDLPNTKEAYVHRVGRSGRYGRKGIAISLVTEKDSKAIREIERHYKIKIKNLPADLKNL
jgi:ATP-dependent RNA helicase